LLASIVAVLPIVVLHSVAIDLKRWKLWFRSCATCWWDNKGLRFSIEWG